MYQTYIGPCYIPSKPHNKGSFWGLLFMPLLMGMLAGRYADSYRKRNTRRADDSAYLKHCETMGLVAYA